MKYILYIISCSILLPCYTQAMENPDEYEQKRIEEFEAIYEDPEQTYLQLLPELLRRYIREHRQAQPYFEDPAIIHWLNQLFITTLPIPYAQSIHFNQNGKYVYGEGSNQKSYLFNLKIQNLITNSALFEQNNQLDISPGGTYAISGNPYLARTSIVNLTTNTKLDYLGENIRSATISPNDRYCTIEYNNGSYAVFDLEIQEKLSLGDNITYAIVSYKPQSSYVAVRYAGGTGAIFNLDNNNEQVNIDLGDNIIPHGIFMQFSPDNAYIAVQRENPDNPQKLEIQLYNLQTQRPLDIHPKDSMKLFKFSPDGQYALIQYLDKPAELYDLHTKKLLNFPANADATSFVFSPNGEYIIVKKFNDETFQQTAKLYHINTQTMRDLPDNLFQATFISNNKILIKYTDQTAQLLDLPMLQPISLALGEQVGDTIASDNGEYLFITIPEINKLFDMNTLQQIYTFDSNIARPAFSPDNRYLGYIENYKAKLFPLHIKYLLSKLSQTQLNLIAEIHAHKDGGLLLDVQQQPIFNSLPEQLQTALKPFVILPDVEKK